MDKKLSEEIKNTVAFTFGKVNLLNNRESGRFAKFFENNDDFIASKNNQSLVRNYLLIAKEPRVFKSAFTNDDGSVNRSKLVMAYEKERKAYNKIAELRKVSKNLVDASVSTLQAYDWPGSSNRSFRMYALEQVLRNTPVKVA
jgi:hypothetical protein